MVSVETIPTLIITGPCGVGKSAVSEALSEILDQTEIPHALVDMDHLRCCYPRPIDDPFHLALGYLNLATVWANYRAAGAKRLIIVDIVETRVALANYKEAVPGGSFSIVRLWATLPTISRRLRVREAGPMLAWHQHRAAELARHWRHHPVEDVLVDTEGKTVDQVVGSILAHTRW